MSDFQVTFLLLGISFISLLLGGRIVRQRRTPLELRAIGAYQQIPVWIDEAVESAQAPHLSFGSAALGQTSTLTLLAKAQTAYYLFRRLSFQKRAPLITLSDPLSLAIASDTLRKAYLARQNLEAFRPNAVVWYPAGEKSLTFAAGAAAHSADLGSGHHLLLGQFGMEAILFAESSRRRRQKMLLGSTQLEGQAIAYISSPAPLIGEEMFVGGAYFNPKSSLAMGSLISLDVLRWAVILGILAVTLFNLITE
jgi:hypothetical protein